MKKIEIVFIGNRFYSESKTMMSSIYKVETGGKYTRYDWGFLQLDAAEGKTIIIRPATEREMEYFIQKLKSL